MRVYAWLIDLIHRGKNCPTGMISGWVQKVTEHRGTIQYTVWWMEMEFWIANELFPYLMAKKESTATVALAMAWNKKPDRTSVITTTSPAKVMRPTKHNKFIYEKLQLYYAGVLGLMFSKMDYVCTDINFSLWTRGGGHSEIINTPLPEQKQKIYSSNWD